MLLQPLFGWLWYILPGEVISSYSSSVESQRVNLLWLLQLLLLAVLIILMKHRLDNRAFLSMLQEHDHVQWAEPQYPGCNPLIREVSAVFLDTSWSNCNLLPSEDLMMSWTLVKSLAPAEDLEKSHRLLECSMMISRSQIVEWRSGLGMTEWYDRNILNCCWSRLGWSSQ